MAPLFSYLDFQAGIIRLCVPGAETHLQELDADLVSGLGVHGPVHEREEDVFVDGGTRIESIRETHQSSDDDTGAEDKVDGPGRGGVFLADGGIVTDSGAGTDDEPGEGRLAQAKGGAERVHLLWMPRAKKRRSNEKKRNKKAGACISFIPTLCEGKKDGLLSSGRPL